MAVDKYIEYIGYEDSFSCFLALLDDKLKNEKKTAKIWCNLDFLPKFRSSKRIIPIYYKKYSCSVTSIKASIKDGKLFEAFCEIIKRIKYRNYVKYFNAEREKKVPCCLNNKEGHLEILEDFKEKDFKGANNTIVLRRYEKAAGMFSNLLVMLPYLRWAKNNGLNVYFDMSRGDNAYRENENENAWEYFYEQTGYKPCLNNGTVISELFKLSDEYKIVFEPKYIYEVIGLNNVYEMYVKLNKKMVSLVNRNCKKILGGGEDIRS